MTIRYVSQKDAHLKKKITKKQKNIVNLPYFYRHKAKRPKVKAKQNVVQYSLNIISCNKQLIESKKGPFLKFFSMTQLLSHTFAHLTGSSFRLKAKLLPIKNILGVKYN